jgi:hypothetical protein
MPTVIPPAVIMPTPTPKVNIVLLSLLFLCLVLMLLGPFFALSWPVPRQPRARPERRRSLLVDLHPLNRHYHLP